MIYEHCLEVHRHHLFLTLQFLKLHMIHMTAHPNCIHRIIVVAVVWSGCPDCPSVLLLAVVVPLETACMVF